MVDLAGNITVGFSASASTIYPSAYFTGRLVADPAGSTRPPGASAAGEDFLLRTLSNAANAENRWGDYSAIALDPDDESTFWHFNQYATVRGREFSAYPRQLGQWATAFGAFTIRDFSVKNDSNGDGYSDLVVHDTSTGALFNYQLDGYKRVAQTRFQSSDWSQSERCLA